MYLGEILKRQAIQQVSIFCAQRPLRPSSSANLAGGAVGELRFPFLHFLWRMACNFYLHNSFTLSQNSRRCWVPDATLQVSYSQAPTGTSLAALLYTGTEAGRDRLRERGGGEGAHATGLEINPCKYSRYLAHTSLARPSPSRARGSSRSLSLPACSSRARPASFLFCEDLMSLVGQEIELDSVGRQFEPYLTAGCVCMLVAPLWCDLGKLWRNPRFNNIKFSTQNRSWLSWFCSWIHSNCSPCFAALPISKQVSHNNIHLCTLKRTRMFCFEVTFARIAPPLQSQWSVSI